jgi:hypothetical protein
MADLAARDKVGDLLGAIQARGRWARSRLFVALHERPLSVGFSFVVRELLHAASLAVTLHLCQKRVI